MEKYLQIDSFILLNPGMAVMNGNLFLVDECMAAGCLSR